MWCGEWVCIQIKPECKRMLVGWDAREYSRDKYMYFSINKNIHILVANVWLDKF